MFFVLPVEEERPVRRFPIVNLLLIGANFYVFFNTYFDPHFERLVEVYGFTPAHAHFRNIISSMFIHEGFAHILGNMYFLYVFGDRVEAYLGSLNYFLAYFLAGFGAVFLQYYVSPHSNIPMIGASGAISGICGLYMFLFPWARMRWQFFFLIFPIFSIPSRAIFVVGLWFAEQYVMAVLTPTALGGVAFWAHVGGFLTGLILFPFLYQKPIRRAS